MFRAVAWRLLAVLLFSFALPSHATTYYVDAGAGSDAYSGLTNIVLSTTSGPMLSIGSAISTASSGDVISVASGFYGLETNWDLSTKALTLLPQGQVIVYQSDPWLTFSIGDGISDGWRQYYFGSSTTTNSQSCATCDPNGNGVSNYMEFENGTDPLATTAISVPSVVLVGSTGNAASVTDLGAGASYSWSIANGTITDGDGTPNVTWTAGDVGVATLTMSLLATDSTVISLSGSAQVMVCSLDATIWTPLAVLAGSTNTASVPSPFVTVDSYGDGAIVGITQGSDSNFYGRSGDEYDDRIFRITPQGTFTTVWLFNATSDITNGYTTATTTSTASLPVKGRGSDQSLYGVNAWGGLTYNWESCFDSGPYYGYGTVYKLTPQGSVTNLTTLHVFTGVSSNNDGAIPVAGLVQGLGSDSNNFYGATSAGGSNGCSDVWGCCVEGYGTVFKVSGTSTNGYSVLHRFNVTSDGALPNGLCMGSDGFLYGTTIYGGTNGVGNVFKISTNGTSFTILHSFTGAGVDGSIPDASVIQITNFIYGTTYFGGANGDGTVFQVDTNGMNYATLHSFSGHPEDSNPSTGLTQSYDGNLYGTTTYGGAYTNGTIYRLSPPGVLTNFANLYQFTGNGDGNWPNWGGQVPTFSLSTFDGYLYGVTIGTLFKYLPATYTWSITNGTIISGQDTTNITWMPTGTNAVTIQVIVSDSPVCVATNYATVTVAATAVIPTNRLIDWTQAGVPGGIPFRTMIYTNIAAGASESVISNAVLNCPSNEVVQLGSGTFTFNTELMMQKSYVTLRGSTNTYINYITPINNADAVIEISFFGSGAYYGCSNNCEPYRNGVVCAQLLCLPGYVVTNSVNITAGAYQGSTSITMTNTAGLAVGQILGVDQLADTSNTFVLGTATNNVYSCGCRYPEDGGASAWANRGSGNRVLQQYVLVTAINGNNVTFTPGLYSPFWSSNQTPQAFWNVNSNVMYSSIEDMDINANFDQDACVDIVGAYGCWVRNCTFHKPTLCEADTLFAKNCEYRHCTFTDFAIPPSSGLYGFEPISSSDLRFEDNIFSNYYNAVNFAGVSGAVFAYNYFTNDITQNQYPNPPYTDDDVGNPTWNFFPHVGHSSFNLVEGNYVRSQTFDCLYGNSSYNTTFRNRLTGPEGTNDGWVERIMAHIYYFSAVGNVYGSMSWGMDYEGTSGNDIWCYSTVTNNGAWYDVRIIDPRVTNTLFRGGNWDAVNNAIEWGAVAAQTITNSLAYPAEPAWYTNECAHCPWPPYDPNLSSTAYPTNTPAGARFFKQGT